MGHATLLVPDGLSFKVLVEVRATMRVKMLILRKSDFDYLLTFYPPPMEHLRDELTDWAEVLRWIELPKVYAKKIRKIAQMTSGNIDTGASTPGEKRASIQRKRLGSVVLNSAVGMPFFPGGIRAAPGGTGMGSARGGYLGGVDTEKGRRNVSSRRSSAEDEGGDKRERSNIGRRISSRKELRVQKDGVGSETVASRHS